MKCINCDIDNKLKDRTKNIGRCKNCGHNFVFEPTIMLGNSIVTDSFFAKLIFDISANNTLFFTPTQLYYLLIKRLQYRPIKKDWAIVLFAALLTLTNLMLNIDKGKTIEAIITIVIGVGMISMYLIYQKKDKILIDREQFHRWLARWNSINDSPEKILPVPETNSLPAAPNPEVTAYSFDRVIVCDTPEIAQLLISNNFHFENNCAILTIDGYPQSIFTTTMEMLRRNPDLKVYALHNCSPSGIQLTHRLRADDTWFPDLAIPIIDVGILPRQIMNNLDLLILQSSESVQTSQQLAPDIRNSLNPAELAWLDAGCYLELESFSPRKLIQILQRSISESRELVAIEDDEMGSTKNTGYYTVESFG